MAETFAKIDKRFDKVDHELHRINDRLDELAKVLMLGFVSLTGGMLAGFGRSSS